MKIWRIRQYSGSKGGSNYYHHADVIAPKWWMALRAAKEGRVQNWRWVDRYDTSDTDYVSYEYLYEVTDDAREPRKPLTKLQKRTKTR